MYRCSRAETLGRAYEGRKYLWETLKTKETSLVGATSGGSECAWEVTATLQWTLKVEATNLHFIYN